MELEMIVGGTVGGLALAYAAADYIRGTRIDKATDGLITDSVRNRIQGELLVLPQKESYTIAGFETYKAVKRYERVYERLQELGEEAEFKELMKLFAMD